MQLTLQAVTGVGCGWFQFAYHVISRIAMTAAATAPTLVKIPKIMMVRQLANAAVSGSVFFTLRPVQGELTIQPKSQEHLRASTPAGSSKLS